MIKLKLAFGAEHKPNLELDNLPNELLSDAVKRAIVDVPLNNKEIHEVFQVVLNGGIIDHQFWPTISLKENDLVIITPLIKSGDSGQIFKIAAILAIAVAAPYLAPYLSITSVVGTAAFSAGLTMGASMLLNSLIPPPVAKFDGDFSYGSSVEASQMYLIEAQSNAVKRLGTVPKVYGRHRVFPTVAANPFTQLEIDPLTNELVQYLYVVYDFGLGQMIVEDIHIGDTPLSSENFNGFEFNLVDFNRPVTSEGVWDDPLKTSLSLYKGDFQADAASVDLDGNFSAGDPISQYQAIRNSATNSDLVGQEIIINFVNPLGLYGFSATGVREYRQIDLDIYFSKTTEDIWHAYNDLNQVSSFSSQGGDTDFELDLEIFVPDNNVGDPLDDAFYESVAQTSSYGGNQKYVRLKAGTFAIVAKDNALIQAGKPVMFNGRTFLGNVVSKTADSHPGFVQITLDRAFDVADPIATYNRPNGTSNFRISQKYGAIARLAWATPGLARIKRNDTNPVYSSFRFTPKEAGQYKVRVRRLSTSGAFNTNVADDLTWSSIATRFDRSPIITDKRHVFLELRMKATGQLNGTIQDLSATCNSVLEVYDDNTETWTKEVTKNPAWIFCDLLTGEVNRKAVPKSRLHMPSIVEWAEFCDEVPTPPPSQDYTMPRFESNFVLDYATPLQNLLNQVCGSAQASLNIIDGKYGILIDKLRNTPVQVFTPRNSKDFSSTRIYGPRPNGLKVRYIEPERNWEVTEIIAYDDGFTEANSETFDELTAFACTNNEQAWRFGRYMIAQNKLRQETISILVDFEHLVCTRGDYVQITQDVMRVGGTPARVKSISGDNVIINDKLETDPLLDYAYVVRKATGEIVTSTCTVIAPNEFELDGDLPAVGDLIVIGELGSVVYDCIVKTISPNDDLSASITLVEKADAIYDAESTGTLPEYDPQISTTSNPNFKPPSEVQNLTVADNARDCAVGGGYLFYVDLIWDSPLGAAYELFNIFVDTGSGGFVQVEQTRNRMFRYIVDEDDLDIQHTFKVIAVSATGRKLPLGSVTGVTATPVSKTTPPSDVESLSADITNEVLQLSWPKIADCDADQYIIRYSPDVNATWSSSVPLTIVDASASSVSVQARTGRYFVKAIDFAGNISALEASAVTTIPNLFNLNVIEEIVDDSFVGSKDRTVIVGPALQMQIEVAGDIYTQKYYEEGYFYYSEILDLTDIYTVRLQSLIQAQGSTDQDLMINWPDLSSITLLSHARFDEWHVETQYRSSDTLNSIAGWATLSSILTMSEGDTSSFTAWRAFIMGDATGRVFQFRLKLASYKASVTPRVFETLIRADMPDRVVSFENLLAPASGSLEIDYVPPFKGPSPSPNVQVTIEDSQSGDYVEYVSKTLSGVELLVRDKDDIQVARTVDVSVKGYGHKYSVSI